MIADPALAENYRSGCARNGRPTRLAPYGRPRERRRSFPATFEGQNNRERNTSMAFALVAGVVIAPPASSTTECRRGICVMRIADFVSCRCAGRPRLCRAHRTSMRQIGVSNGHVDFGDFRQYGAVAAEV